MKHIAPVFIILVVGGLAIGGLVVLELKTREANSVKGVSTMPLSTPTALPATPAGTTHPQPSAAPTSAPRQAPVMQIDVKKTYVAVLKTTKGDISVSLNAAATPITVNNFVSLSREGFYNNTVFHRVMKGFMIQGGDPTGTGTGGPGYRFADEPFEGEYTRGTIAMANAGPNTNGSQFFIMHADYPLPKNYVIFGKVSNGIEVVDAIATAPVQSSRSGESSSPVEPVSILSVEITEK